MVPRDISLAKRILASFYEDIPESQRHPNILGELGRLVKNPDTNIIKLPNISASLPQLKFAIEELQSQGYAIPSFPDEPQNQGEEKTRARYTKLLGSAVNPVLREGNSDRRVAPSVKEYAKAHPHFMGAWSSGSKSHVAHMSDGDFYSSEKSVVLQKPTTVCIEFINSRGEVTVLKEKIELLDGEIIDAATMSLRQLSQFFQNQIQEAKEQGVLFSLHLKSTMMKVSDPIIFGEAVKAFFKDVFDKYAVPLAEANVSPSHGLGNLLSKIENFPSELKNEIQQVIHSCYERGPALAMVDSDKGVSNLHVPSDVIIDASMPAAIRASGKMWGPDNKLHDIKAVIPDRSYAGIYQDIIEFCKKYGAFDVESMGHVSNVGLMAKKAEEYGSHDKTFQVNEAGKVRVRVVNSVVDQGQMQEGAQEDALRGLEQMLPEQVLMEHAVESGDIWRMCQTKDVSVKDWVELAIGRVRATGTPAIFWLDPQRPHDVHIAAKVKSYLQDRKAQNHEQSHEAQRLVTQGDVTQGHKIQSHITHQDFNIKMMSPVEAMGYTLQRVRNGQDTISVTGNVLRDYLTDLFPILELGTSAKMLSIVPLLGGGGLFETGAGDQLQSMWSNFKKKIT